LVFLREEGNRVDTAGNPGAWDIADGGVRGNFDQDLVMVFQKALVRDPFLVKNHPQVDISKLSKANGQMPDDPAILGHIAKGVVILFLCVNDGGQGILCSAYSQIIQV
jgi:hypothetical protein